MATKAQADASLSPCSVCGGDLNPNGECSICGTKHDQKRPPAATPVSKKAPQPELPAWVSKGAGGVITMVREPPRAAADPSDDALRKWLTGEEDAFEQWLGGTIVEEKVGPQSDLLRRLRDKDRTLQAKEATLRAQGLELAGVRAELDAVKGKLAQDLGALKTGTFDPMKYMEDLADLSKERATEVAKRRELEEEIQHIKKGSVAIIRYIKSQQLKQNNAQEIVRKQVEDQLGTRRKADAELAQAKELVVQLRRQVEKGIASAKPDEKALKQRELDLLERESALKAREEAQATLAEERGADVGAVPEELRRRMEEELREKEQDHLHREDELKKRIIVLEQELNKNRIEAKLREDAARYAGKSKPEVEGLLAQKENELQAKEKSILLRESEIQRLRDDLNINEEELKKLKEPLAYKEEELLRREEDLLYREKLMQAQLRKMEEAKRLGGSTDELELKERLEQLKSEIARKEDEVRAKEKYLKGKMEELRLREQGLIEEEIDAREIDREMEVKQEKVKIGTPRLDDLLLGGVPFGSNVSIYGPPYVGKEVIVDTFLAEGLKKGVPILWVLTDKMPGDIREEMTFVLPGYEEYEKMGLVKYVDAYSKSMGADTNDPNVTYIDDPTDFVAIAKNVDAFANEFRKKHPYYRLAFRSISTLIAYLDPTTTFKFLQPFCGRRKRDKAVGMYIIEKGMHEEREIEMLGSVMDGALEFKVEQLRTFLSVKGICDVQSRAWIRYTHSKSGVSVGSFSLDHIK